MWSKQIGEQREQTNVGNEQVAQYVRLNSWLFNTIVRLTLLLVAAVAATRPVVRRKTYCLFLFSSHVRNFSCSAWNKRTTSPPFRMSSLLSLERGKAEEEEEEEEEEKREKERRKNVPITKKRASL